MRLSLSSFLCVFLLPATASAADVKHWVDQNGQVHFGDTAPAGTLVETKTLSAPTEIGTQSKWSPRSGEREMLRRHEERGRSLEEAKKRSVEEYRRGQESKKVAQKRRARCDYYRKRLDYYEAKRRQGYTREEKDSIDLSVASYEMKVKTYCD